MPSSLDPSEFRNLVAASKALMIDERPPPRAIPSCPDPAVSVPPPVSQVMDSADIAGLRKKFNFLKDFSDDFIKKTPLEILLKTETTAIKIREFERNKAVGDRLAANREDLAETFSTIQGGVDNRWDKIHEARFLPGACCSATAMWMKARETIGLKGHEPVATYDMASIGLGGFVSKRGWVELHNMGSDSISLKMFNINSCGTKISSKGSDGSDEFKDVTELGEFKLSLRVAREALSFVHPWNKSLAALEGFMFQTDFCRGDLVGAEKPAMVLTQFCDYIMATNADRWRGFQPFVTTGEMKGVWDAFWGAKPESKKKSFNKPRAKFSFNSGFFDDICRMYNLGRCIKHVCTTKSGIPLRHVCNYAKNPAKPSERCEMSHMAIFMHPPPPIRKLKSKLDSEFTRSLM
jgi:hypothetical protein